ncbi:hypothetical protein ACS0TY_005560 [Phlomoides rotata]
MNNEKKKKRKMEDNEEEEMNKFFALIKSTREVRNQLVGASSDNREKLVNDNKPPAATELWKPTFRLEDFLEAPSLPPPPETNKANPSMEVEKQEGGAGEKREEDKGILDLNLSL